MKINFLSFFAITTIIFSPLNAHSEEPSGTKLFGGLTLGVGLSLTHDLGNHDRIESASVVNGIVRVTEEKNDIARIMLESHYFFVPNRNAPLISSVRPNEWGWGPFVAVQPGDSDIIDAIALGVMIGFKRSEDSKDLSSWNIGIGGVVDPSVRVLGDGIKKNQPLPAGETEVRYETKSQGGIVILTSFSW